MIRRPTKSPLLHYTTLFRSRDPVRLAGGHDRFPHAEAVPAGDVDLEGELAGEGDAAHARRHAGHLRVADVHEAEGRSEEHTSELKSRQYLVCRLLLEKKIIN